MIAMARPYDAETMEINMLLEGIRDRYGYDFTHYARASLKRRINRIRDQAQLGSYISVLDRVLRDEAFFDEFLRGISITVTEMFRDPSFYLAFRQKVVPVLKTYPFVKIWHAGCATGEEVYSMAILMHEEGFLDRTRIYATDFNKHSLDFAQKGVYSTKNIDLYMANYVAAGGAATLSDYYSAGYEFAKIKDYLKSNLTFSYHNLVTDGVFGEMNVICCRNVLIYFDKTLQDHVLGQFTLSLRHGGFLCLGTKETLNFTVVKPFFEAEDARQRIYRKSGTFNE